jgi:flagellar hook-associated protein 1 FlgK
MSFSTIRNIATSSLMATSVQTALASANIANADVEGYSRKTATQTSTVTGGEGSGTTITTITSKVNKFLVQAVSKALSDVGATSTNETYSNRLQSLFGQTIGGEDSSSGTSLANLLASLETSLTNLAATPEGESLQASVVDKFGWIATQLRQISAGVQDLRAEADAEIKTGITEVNNSLETIDDLNLQIGIAASRGSPTADLEDKRNTALQAVAKKMDISYFINSAGAMNIYTTTGQALLTNTVHPISYTASGGVTASTKFNPITVNGVDITTSFTSGEIGALIEQRDDTLAAVQDELDEFAAKFINAVNAVHNTGTSLPPPDTLTGTTTITPAQAAAPFTGSGKVVFAVVKDDGTLDSASVEVDLSKYKTLDALVAHIDTIPGINASLASGSLVEEATSPGTTGVAIANNGTTTLNGVTQGFSDYFGLNDLLIGSSSSDISVRADLQATPGMLSSSTLSTTATAAGAKALTAGDADVPNALYDALTKSQSFDAAGRLGASSTSFASYAADIVADVAAVASNAGTAANAADSVHNNLSDSLASQSGVNIDEETALLSELEKLYSTASQIIATLNAMFDALLAAAKSA